MHTVTQEKVKRVSDRGKDLETLNEIKIKDNEFELRDNVNLKKNQTTYKLLEEMPIQPNMPELNDASLMHTGNTSDSNFSSTPKQEVSSMKNKKKNKSSTFFSAY